jgi:hypothetical protein
MLGYEVGDLGVWVLSLGFGFTGLEFRVGSWGKVSRL